MTDDDITHKGKIEYTEDFKVLSNAIDALLAVDSRIVYEIYKGGDEVENAITGLDGLIDKLQAMIAANPELKIHD